MNNLFPIILHPAAATELPAQYEFRFDLPPMTDQCLRYWLHIEPAPAQAVVSLNDYLLEAQTGKSFSADVTDFVTLDDNVLRVGEIQRELRRVWLQPVPCG